MKWSSNGAVMGGIALVAAELPRQCNLSALTNDPLDNTRQKRVTKGDPFFRQDDLPFQPHTNRHKTRIGLVCDNFRYSSRSTSGDQPMNTDIREPRALESYATFWEPVANEPTPPTATNTTNSVEVKDAYSEFVNVTEGVPASLPAERT